MSKRISAIMRQTWYEAAKRNLPDLERLAFYEAVFDYCYYEELPNRTKTGEKGLLMFDFVRDELDEDRDKIKRIQERNQMNGQRGGRPVGQKVTNPVGYLETQTNPDEPKGTQKTPIQNNTIQNITKHAAPAANAAAGSGGLDESFFEAQLWPRLNAEGQWNSRHRKCVAAWCSYSERKRTAIMKAVLSDAFAGKENPFFYMEDFKEPGAHYLTPPECDAEWKAGRDVYLVKIAEGSWKTVSETDFVQFGLDALPYKIMKPER